MKEIEIKKWEVVCCVGRCCFDGGVRYYEEGEVVVVTDGEYKKYLKKKGRQYDLHREDGYYYTYKEKAVDGGFFLEGRGVTNGEFAIETKHLVCGNCGSFCEQECFF